ncbi:uncharacterized protein LOC141594032 [Silene latifolia]|uniref:uncharacterized protein LOC141594032 n=1 Tax=Silene latifolia TaxID=37657 RepID=UPI003D77A61D
MGNCVASRDPPVSRKLVRKPEPWVYIEPITRAELDMLREEFWAQPYRRGRTEIWDALRTAALSELPIAQDIIEANGIFHQFNDLHVCYDDTGVRYEVPLYCLSEPENLICDNYGLL